MSCLFLREGIAKNERRQTSRPPLAGIRIQDAIVIPGPSKAPTTFNCIGPSCLAFAPRSGTKTAKGGSSQTFSSTHTHTCRFLLPEMLQRLECSYGEDRDSGFSYSNIAPSRLRLKLVDQIRHSFTFWRLSYRYAASFNMSFPIVHLAYP